MLMLDSKDKLIEQSKWNLLLNNLDSIPLLEQKLFKFLLTKSLLNQLFKTMLNKEKFIMYKLQLLKEFQYKDLSQYQHQYLEKFQLLERFLYQYQVKKIEVLKLLI